jgi:hypothetical protein
MVIDKINVESFAVLKSENDPPICAHRDRPKAFEIARQWMQPECGRLSASIVCAA